MWWGTRSCDVELARRIGARSVLVTTGSTILQTTQVDEGASADYVAPGLSEAVDWIIHDVERAVGGRGSGAPTLPFPSKGEGRKAESYLLRAKS